MGNTGAVATAIANYINRQYGGGQVLPSGGLPAVSLLAQAPAAEAAQAAAAAQAVSVQSIPPSLGAPPAHGAPPTPGVPPAHGSSNVIYDWAARIHAKKFELGQGYAILIFLGDVPGDEVHWRTYPSFVGAHCAFVNTATDQCANCREQEELVVEGFVHLNEAIAKHSDLSSYEPSVVAPYLKNNLHWRVQAVRSSFLPSSLVLKLSKNLSHSIRLIEPRSRLRNSHLWKLSPCRTL